MSSTLRRRLIAPAAAIGALSLVLAGCAADEPGAGGDGGNADCADYEAYGQFEGETVEIGAGQSFFVERGVKVRYSNPFPEESEYHAVCMPAFAPELAHRDPDA